VRTSSEATRSHPRISRPRISIGCALVVATSSSGERGQMRVNRPELIEQYGFDTKYAGHVLRLGYQGIEFLESGRLTLPMREPERTHVLDVRNGRVSFEDVLAEADDLQHRLEDRLQNSQLPERPDYDRVNKFLAEAYLAWWKRR
jgi:uncharacterized protein